MLATVSSFAQGQVNFNNYTPVTYFFFTDGTTKLDNTYQAQLWAGAAGASLSAVSTATAVKFNSGIFAGGAVTVPVAYGSAMDYVVKVFPVAYASYDAAVTDGKAVGMSALKSLTLAAPPNQPSATVFDSVVVKVVPEPSVIALGALGLGLLILRRRS